MYPNPQDAFPLPPRPSLEHFKKDAKDLAKACKSQDPDAIGMWSEQWVQRLANLQEPRTRDWMLRQIDLLAEFAEQRLEKRCVLAEAQFIIARALGFLSWPKFAKHIDDLTRRASAVSNFEMAADAIVSGDAAALRRLLREDRGLTQARSTREHRATLLHYLSANGVEGYRQKSPKNAVEMARILLDAGAEVDAGADVYGGDWTTLGLVATSAPPDGAGVQIPLLALLLDRGAKMDREGSAGNRHSLVFACLANGQPRAARFLADHGAPLDLLAAAGLGRLEVVRKLGTDASTKDLGSALIWACAYGRNDVIEFLLDNGAPIESQDKDGQTGLHWAVMLGRLETIQLLLQRNAPLDVRNVYGGTPLGQAAWSAAHGEKSEIFIPIIEALIAAGSDFPKRHPPIHPQIDALLERRGSHADPTLSWVNERRRGGRAKS